MADMMTNFTAADMPGAKKPVVNKAAPAPKPAAKKAPAPKVEEPIEVVVETPVEAAQTASETVEEAPAVETKADEE